MISKLFNEEGGYNYEELSAFLERNKKKNYMKAACMRMIKFISIGCMTDGNSTRKTIWFM